MIERIKAWFETRREIGGDGLDDVAIRCRLYGFCHHRYQWAGGKICATTYAASELDRRQLESMF